jgi:hypothetical protein
LRVALVSLKRESDGAFTLRIPDFETPLEVAVIVTAILDGIGFVVTVKEAEPVPANTLTEVGTVAAALFERRFTMLPLGPAFPFRVRVTELFNPPITVAGVAVNALTVAGTTVSVD